MKKKKTKKKQTTARERERERERDEIENITLVIFHYSNNAEAEKVFSKLIFEFIVNEKSIKT
jgi:hypothetical protein